MWNFHAILIPQAAPTTYHDKADTMKAANNTTTGYRIERLLAQGELPLRKVVKLYGTVSGSLAGKDVIITGYYHLLAAATEDQLLLLQRVAALAWLEGKETGYDMCDTEEVDPPNPYSTGL